jgi:hypothetical protein
MRTAALALVLVLQPTASAAPVDFRKDVYPLLHDHCFRCHQGEDAKSGVRLDRRADVLRVAVPGKAADSRLVKLVGGGDPKLVMPAAGPRLSAPQVQLLRDWIDQGLAWDDALLPADGLKSQHWAFQSVKRPAVPVTEKNPIDAFVLANLTAKGLAFATEADRRTLLRRLALDLTGLPPTPEEIDAFVSDLSPDAYEKQVERLLASPHHGERWGRHWLDVARYADSEGYESDHVRPYAWRYRDYVIRAFNDDKPFDRFLTEQIAGDELVPYHDEHLIATGFLAAARLSSNEEDPSRQLNDVYVDIANTTAAAFLGLTFNCAQCHSHKFDPISQKDYYRFQGFFLKGMPYNFALRDHAGRWAYEASKPPEYDPARKLLRTVLEGTKARLSEKARASLTAEQRTAYDRPADQRTPEEHALAVEAGLKLQFSGSQIEAAILTEDRALFTELKKKVEAIEAKLPDPPQAWAFYSPVTSPHAVEPLPMKGFYPPPFDVIALGRSKPFLLQAGDSRRRGPELDVGWPAVFGPTPAAAAELPRTALAAWLTDPSHPLTARVWANRVWQYHFGRGIVATPSDFGVRGTAPSHPELLNWLASELQHPTTGRPWSTKHLHRLIVTSRTYKQSSRNDTAAKLDPDNTLFARWTPRRLEAEAVRDCMLAVSGELDRTIGGKPDSDETKSLRRGVYLLQKRQMPPGVQALFDGPTGATESCPKRLTTATPLHALFLLNNEFPTARATALAGRVRAAAESDPGKQTLAAFRFALGRLPTETERQAVAAFFDKVAVKDDPLALLCHALLAANEFTTLE